VSLIAFKEIEKFRRHGADSIIPTHRFRLEDAAAVERGLRSAHVCLSNILVRDTVLRPRLLIRPYGLWKSSSSTSKLRVAPGGISGGEPRSPYASEDGHTTCDFSPFFIFCSASVQHGTTPFSGRR
jgi:hypothetical protein